MNAKLKRELEEEFGTSNGEVILRMEGFGDVLDQARKVSQ